MVSIKKSVIGGWVAYGDSDGVVACAKPTGPRKPQRRKLVDAAPLFLPLLRGNLVRGCCAAATLL